MKTPSPTSSCTAPAAHGMGNRKEISKVKLTGIIALALILTAGGAAAQERITPEMGAAMNGGGRCGVVEGTTLVCETIDGSKVCRQDEGGTLSCEETNTATTVSPSAANVPSYYSQQSTEPERYTPSPPPPPTF